ncbi:MULTISPECIES: L-lactate dehydrogenase [unclassified Mycoplasma]|uniref:L-lactate dehydrogenase n=1 Tax=unclassified Mycoplasma TaxID=2683645 RepID=UPI00211C265D|nr:MULTISPECIES: L-lactate dehydrogenase [unclassified Mycoplasma]UUM19821.1 L-lactate dehydrogenase [Mycoplasma sp. 1578d]UUM24805.1 L-lactate dehydrogenase [Mycoplasma sp. 3686d]
MKNLKIAIIGSGQVGMSFMYACFNQGLGSEFGIIDVNEKLQKGNVLDLQDSIGNAPINVKVVKASYEDLKDYDFIFISAGRPQKVGETRLQLLSSNAQIMKSIGTSVKESGFKGITLIASNPVDIMTAVYHHATGFEKNKIIGSGTILDTSRLKFAIAQQYGVSSHDVQAYVIGEHGDSSVSVISSARIAGFKLEKFSTGNVEEELKQVEQDVRERAYRIIETKGATYYGIGNGIANILKQVLYDTKAILPVGALLQGQYGIKDIVFGTPCVLGKNGIEKVLEAKLSEKEHEKLTKSAEVISTNTEIVLKELGFK